MCIIISIPGLHLSVLRIFPRGPLYSHSYSARCVGAQYIKFRSVFVVSFWSTEPLSARRRSGDGGRTVAWWARWRLDGGDVRRSKAIRTIRQLLALFFVFSVPRVKRKTRLTFKARFVSSLNKRSPESFPYIMFLLPVLFMIGIHVYIYIRVIYVFRLETSK